MINAITLYIQKSRTKSRENIKILISFVRISYYYSVFGREKRKEAWFLESLKWEMSLYKCFYRQQRGEKIYIYLERTTTSLNLPFFFFFVKLLKRFYLAFLDEHFALYEVIWEKLMALDDPPVPLLFHEI